MEMPKPVSEPFPIPNLILILEPIQIPELILIPLPIPIPEQIAIYQDASDSGPDSGADSGNWFRTNYQETIPENFIFPITIANKKIPYFSLQQ